MLILPADSKSTYDQNVPGTTIETTSHDAPPPRGQLFVSRAGNVVGHGEIQRSVCANNDLDDEFNYGGAAGRIAALGRAVFQMWNGQRNDIDWTAKDIPINRPDIPDYVQLGDTYDWETGVYSRDGTDLEPPQLRSDIQSSQKPTESDLATSYGNPDVSLEVHSWGKGEDRQGIGSGSFANDASETLSSRIENALTKFLKYSESNNLSISDPVKEMARELIIKGEKENIDVLKDPVILQEVLRSFVSKDDNITTSEFESKLSSLTDLILTPKEEIIPTLLTMDFQSSEGMEKLQDSALKEIDSLGTGLQKFIEKTKTYVGEEKIAELKEAYENVKGVYTLFSKGSSQLKKSANAVHEHVVNMHNQFGEQADRLDQQRARAKASYLRQPLEKHFQALFSCPTTPRRTIYEAEQMGQQLICQGEKLRNRIESYNSSRIEQEGKLEDLKRLNSDLSKFFTNEIEKIAKQNQGLYLLVALGMVAFDKGIQACGVNVPAQVENAAFEQIMKMFGNRLKGLESDYKIAMVSIASAYDCRSGIIFDCLAQASSTYNGQVSLQVAREQFRNLMDPAQYRKELTKDLEDLGKQKEDVQKQKENAQKGKTDAEQKAKKTRDERDRDYTKKRKSRAKRKTAEIAEADADAEKCGKRVESADETLEDLSERGDALDKKIASEEQVKHIRDQGRDAVQTEKRKFEGPNEDIANFRRTLFENTNNYLEARNSNANPVRHTLSAARELAVIIDNKDTTEVISLATQGYELFNMGLYWQGFAIPQAISLLKDGNANQVFQTLFSATGMATYVVPFLQTAVLVASLIRSIKSRMNKKEVTSKEKQIIDALQEGLNQLRSQIFGQIKGVNVHIEKIFEQIGEEFSNQTTMLIGHSSSLSKEIKAESSKVYELIENVEYRSRIQNQQDKENGFVTYEEVSGCKNTKPKHLDQKFQIYQSKIEEQLIRCLEGCNNFYNESIPTSDVPNDREVTPLLQERWMSSNPEQFTGYLAKRLDSTAKISNASMFLKTGNRFLQDLSQLTSRQDVNTGQLKSLLVLLEGIRRQGNNLIDFFVVNLEDAIKKVQEKHELLLNDLNRRSIRNKKQRLKFLKASFDIYWDLKKSQRRRLKGPGIIGSDKEKLNHIVHMIQLAEAGKMKKLNLNWLDTRLKGRITGVQTMGHGSSAIAIAAPLNAIPVLGNIMFVFFASLAMPASGAINGGERLVNLINDRFYEPITIEKCYEHVEDCILKSLAQSTHEIAKTTFLSLTQEEAQQRVRRLRNHDVIKITFRIVYSLSEDRFVQAFNCETGYVYLWKKEPSYLTKGSTETQNATDLLSMKIHFDLPTQSCRIETNSNSFLQLSDIEAIKPPTWKTKDEKKVYDQSVQNLMTGYLKYIKAFHEGKQLASGHAFKVVEEKSVLISNEGGSLLPLAFPRALIDLLYTRLQSASYRLQLTDEGNDLIPSYNLCETASGNSYKLKIHFKTTKNEMPFQTFEIATFDKNSYMGFGRFDVKKIENSGETKDKKTKDDFVQRGPNPNAFLIQMMYSGMCPGLGMPGKGTYSIRRIGVDGTERDLVAPVEHRFLGLWSLLHFNGGRVIHFDSSSYDGSQDFMTSLYNMLGDEYPSVFDESHGDITNGLAGKENMKLEALLEDYRSAYQRLKTHCMWLSAISPIDLQEEFRDKLQLREPTSILNLYREVREENFFSKKQQEEDIPGFKHSLTMYGARDKCKDLMDLLVSLDKAREQLETKIRVLDQRMGLGNQMPVRV